MRKICVIDWQSYPSLCDTLFSVYSMIRRYGFYPKRMIRHYVIHPTNYSISRDIQVCCRCALLKTILGVWWCAIALTHLKTHTCFWHHRKYNLNTNINHRGKNPTLLTGFSDASLVCFSNWAMKLLFFFSNVFSLLIPESSFLMISVPSRSLIFSICDKEKKKKKIKKKRYIRTLSFNLPLFILPFTNTSQSIFIISLKIKVFGPWKKCIKNAGDFLIVRYASLISHSLSTLHRAHTISAWNKDSQSSNIIFYKKFILQYRPFQNKMFNSQNKNCIDLLYYIENIV